MAKKQANSERVILVRGMDTGDGEPETEVDQDELRAIQEMDGGSDVKWTVMRTSDTGDRKAGFCGELMTGDLSMGKIAEEWGRGKYRVRGTRSNGTFVKQYTIVVAEDPKRPTQTLMPAGPANSVQDMLALMDARDEKQSEKMLKWAAILSPILAPALANLFGQQKGTTLTELTTALASIKALDGGGKVDQMEEFTKLLSLVKEVQGDGGQVAGSNWVDVVRDGIQGLPHIVAGVAAAAKGVPLPNAAPTGAAPQAQLTQEETMLAWLKRQLEALTFQASMNKDPGLYAEVMLDNLPAGADIKQLNEYLSRPDWWSLLTTFSPGVQPYPQWFAECREELLKGLAVILTPPQGVTVPAKAPKAPKPTVAKS